MFKRKFFLIVLVVFLIGPISVIQVSAGDVEKININTATAEELKRLNGVGSKYADRIIAYREKFGPFKASEDIMHVPGIGLKTFEKTGKLSSSKNPKITRSGFKISDTRFNLRLTIKKIWPKYFYHLLGKRCLGYCDSCYNFCVLFAKRFVISGWM